MNTVEKGNAFENRTYEILNTLLEKSELEIRLERQNELWIVPSTASVNQKVVKQFPWGDNVINDLTIENNEKLINLLYYCLMFVKKMRFNLSLSAKLFDI